MAPGLSNAAATSGYRPAPVSAAGAADQFEVEGIENASSFHGLIGRSPSMRQLILRMQRMAAHIYVAMIEGQSGTGRTTAARALHAASPVAGGAFIACRATQFFIAADSSCRSRWSTEILEQAIGGTLFLDGVNQLSPAQQEALAEFLGWLDDRRFAGAHLHDPRNHDAEYNRMPGQVLFSSSRPLRLRAGATSFREDVASRLSAVHFCLPPLNERREDIPLLAQVFIQRFARTYGKSVRGLGPGTIAPLLRYSWPGNVRELEDAITSAALETEAQWIRPIDLPPLSGGTRLLHESPVSESSPASALSGSEGDLTLDTAIHRHVVKVLQRTKGNKLRAASLLCISRSTLYRILETKPEVASSQQQSYPTAP